MKVILSTASIILSTLLITGCGGGSSDSNNTTNTSPSDVPPSTVTLPVTYNLNGMAIKGPLANATINVYELDTASANLKGDLVSNGVTNELANIEGVTLSNPLSAYYYLEIVAVDGTIDLNTGSFPLITSMSGLISQSQLESQQEIVISPLTSLINKLVSLRINNTSDFSTILADSSNTVMSLFPSSDTNSFDPHTDIPVVTGDSVSLQSTLVHRTILESLAALNQYIIEGNDLSTEQFFDALAKDLKDGDIDGLDSGTIIEEYTQNINLLDNILGAPIEHMPLVGTDKDNDPSTQDPYLISEINQLLSDEQSVLSISGDTSPLLDGSITFKLTPLSEDYDGDGFPDLTDNDDDNDGVVDTLDALPKNVNESVDTDLDGVGDNTDAYPNDSTCYITLDGNGEDCHLTRMATSNIVVRQVETLTTNKIAFAISHIDSSYIDEVLIFNLETNHFESSVLLEKITNIAFINEHERLYLGSEDGQISFIKDNEITNNFAQVDGDILSLANAGDYLLVSDNSGAWATRTIFNVTGNLVVESEWTNHSNTYAWNGENSRVYHFRDDTSPNDLIFVEIEQSSGNVIRSEDSRYHGDYSIQAPIIIYNQGTQVLLGSGDVYTAENLEWVGSLGYSFSYGYTNLDNNLITIKTVNNASVLERRTISNVILEQVGIEGTIVDLIYHDLTGYIITEHDNQIKISQYTPSDDSDIDGVVNTEDAFPLDAAASIDTDGDGYPDEWNINKTQSDSVTGLVIDNYPADSACWLLEHGQGDVCNIESTMPTFVPTAIEYDDNGVIYLFNNQDSKIYRWSSDTQSYLNPLSVGNTSELNNVTPLIIEYSSAHHRLYTGYASGEIKYIELSDPQEEISIINIAQSVGGLAAVGDYMLAQDSSGAWNTHYIFDENGNLTDSQDWNRYSRTYDWNEHNSRVYFLRDGTSPNDLHYEEISQVNGTITSDGESPYHTSEGISHPVHVTSDGAKVVLGSGYVFDAETLEYITQLDFDATQVRSINGILVSAEDLTNNNLKLWSENTSSLIGQFDIDGEIVSIIPFNDDAIILSIVDDEFQFSISQIADSDEDGLPGWWEELYALNDEDNSDANLDSDNDGLTNIQEFEAGTNPNNIDTDDDGLNDSNEVNQYLTNPISSDSDSDGLSDADEVNLYNSNPNLIDTDEDGLSDFLEVTQYDTNPLLADSDSDGMNDLWEIENGLNAIVDDSQLDLDNDGLTNTDELTALTDPNKSDSDADGLSDGDEVNTHLTDPLSNDSDGDKMEDGYEILYAFNPLLNSDALLDFDVDGYSNMEEFFLASNPILSDDIPVIAQWNTWQGNSGFTGFLPIQMNPENISQRWQVDINTNKGQVISNDDQIFAVSHQNGEMTLIEISPVFGTPIWSSSADDSNGYRTPMIVGERAYFQSRDYLRALNAETGSLIYRKNIGHYYNNSVLSFSDDLVYATGFRSVIAVNLNGEDTWSTSFNNSQFGAAVTPAGVVIGDNTEINFIDTLTGENTLSVPFEQLYTNYARSIRGSYNNTIVRRNQTIFNIDTDLQTVIWEKAISQNYSDSKIAIAYGSLYVANDTLQVFDEKSGILQWSFEIPNGESIVSNIAVGRNFIIMGTNSTTYAVSLETHDIIWQVDLVGELSLSNSGVLFIAGDEVLTAFDLGIDTDNDGLLDWWESFYGLNINDASDAILDSDGDGLNNLEEFALLTNPILADTDGDTLDDGDEILTHNTNPLLTDSDSDELSDSQEVDEYNTNPNNSDSDNDGLQDAFEVNNSLDANDSTDAELDVDNDGYSTLEEFFLGTDPNSIDSAPSQQPWSTFQGNASHTGFTLQSIVNDDIEQLWQLEIDHQAEQIVASNGKAYLTVGQRYSGNNHSLLAMSAYSGETLWENDYSDLYILNAPALLDDNVIIQSGGHEDSFVLSLSSASGETQFQTAYGNQWSQYLAPTPFDNNIYVAGGSYGGSYGFNIEGEELFFTDLAQVDNWTPTVTTDFIFACQNSSETEILDRLTGETNATIVDKDWYGCAHNTVATLGSYNNLIAQNNQNLTSYSLNKNEIMWQVNSENTQPSVGFGRVYTLNSGVMNVFDELTGDLLWSFEVSETLTSNIVLTINKVIVSSNSQTYIIDIDSQDYIELDVGGTSLSLSEGILYISDGTKITAFNVEGDEDNDGLPNNWELAYGLNYQDSADALLDLDNDGLNNFEEFTLNTRPDLSDTDNDLLSDGEEVNTHDTNPTLSDTDQDGLSDADEINTHLTSPLLSDTDGDQFSDFQEIYQYQTDPNDASSLPQSITSIIESFENTSVPVLWRSTDSSDANWEVDTTYASEGSNSIRSGDINDNEMSSIVYEGLFSDGHLSFDYKIDSESCCDKLHLYINDELKFISSGINTWINQTIEIPQGQHILEWRYSKDSSVSTVEDAAWIDNIIFESSGISQ